MEALPGGTQFRLPARLAFVLAEAAAPGSRLTVFQLNLQMNAYEPTGFTATVDENGRLASVDVTHFSIFAVLAPVQSRPWTLQTGQGAPGSAIRITGTGLESVLQASFQGVWQSSILGTIVSHSTSELIVRVPERARSGLLILVTAGGAQSFPFQVIVAPEPAKPRH